MTIQVEVSPEVEARLAANAAAQGLAIEDYASKILSASIPIRPQGTGILRPGDVDRMTEELTRGSENLPVLPPDATERQSFYEDHR